MPVSDEKAIEMISAVESVLAKIGDHFGVEPGDVDGLFAAIEAQAEDLSAARQSLYEVAEQRNSLTAEVTRLQGIVGQFFEDWPEPWAEGMDGFELQRWGEKHGVLIRRDVIVPCGENCGCREYYCDGEEPMCYALAPEFIVSGSPGQEPNNGA